MKSPESVLIRPLVLTEKGNRMRDTMGKYLFEVAEKATKIEIRHAVERLFDVKVKSVRTMICRGKPGRLGRRRVVRPRWKKAIVTLAEGNRIDLFETV